ncbi:MAG: hypothetical protein NVSMB2_23050 [Chloroflexota bacterium]
MNAAAPDVLPTTVVGSYPQPDWLVDRDKLRTRLPPRVRARDVWRVPEPRSSLTVKFDPRVVGPIRRIRPVEVDDVRFLRACTDAQIKITVPGPFTMTQQTVDDFYGDEQRLAFDFADALNAELRDLVADGADVIQIDEPYLQARAESARGSTSRFSNAWVTRP